MLTFNHIPVSDATFNVNETYFVEEDNGPATLCVLLADGCLERDVVVQYSTFDATALSMLLCTHMQSK